MGKIVVTNRIFPEVERRLRALGEVIIDDRGAPWSRDELIVQLHDADAMLAFMTDAVDAELLSHCPRLKIVSGALKGHDNFDVEACTRAVIWQVEWDELIAASDVIILALPLNEHTFHMIDAQSLSRMRRGSRLVNVGRGSVVDEEAVTQSLEQRHLGGYAADVFEMEDRARDERPRAVLP